MMVTFCLSVPTYLFFDKAKINWHEFAKVVLDKQLYNKERACATFSRSCHMYMLRPTIKFNH